MRTALLLAALVAAPLAQQDETEARENAAFAAVNKHLAELQSMLAEINKKRENLGLEPKKGFPPLRRFSSLDRAARKLARELEVAGLKTLTDTPAIRRRAKALAEAEGYKGNVTALWGTVRPPLENFDESPKTPFERWRSSGEIGLLYLAADWTEGGAGVFRGRPAAFDRQKRPVWWYVQLFASPAH